MATMSLGFNEYQQNAVRTCGPDSSGWEHSTLVIALGVGGEAGEVQELIKKSLGHGHKLSKAELAKEIGDCLWYLAVLAHRYDIPLEQIAQLNENKLRARYPEGFSQQASINRTSDEPSYLERQS